MATPIEMEASVPEAVAELDKLFKLAERKNGQPVTAEVVVQWVHRWYLKTGYKRLMRHLFSVYDL